MSRHHRAEVHHVGRAGWFAVGALAASVAFALIFIAGDYLNAAGNEPDIEANVPPLIIEGQ